MLNATSILALFNIRTHHRTCFPDDSTSRLDVVFPLLSCNPFRSPVVYSDVRHCSRRQAELYFLIKSFILPPHEQLRAPLTFRIVHRVSPTHYIAAFPAAVGQQTAFSTTHAVLLSSVCTLLLLKLPLNGNAYERVRTRT